MGNITPNLQIWTPDGNDLGEPDIYLATMAQSLEDGVGARLTLQEQAVGLKGSCANAAWTIPANNAPAVVPYTISSSRGDFTQGLTITGGVISVATPGMYLVTANLGPQGSGTGVGVKILLDKNSGFIASGETAMNNPIWGVAQVTAVLNCIAGDTIRVRGTLTNTTGTMTTSAETTHISVAMIQAVPQ